MRVSRIFFRWLRALSIAPVLAFATGCGSEKSVVTVEGPHPVVSVNVSPSTVALTIGEKRQLAASVLGGGGIALTGRVVTWSSSSSTVVAVSPSGEATAIAVGSAIVTASSEGKTGSATVIVAAPPAPPLTIVSLSSMTARPMSALSVRTSALDTTGAQFFVRFYDDNGFSVDVGSTEFRSNSLLVLVPPFLDVARRAFGAGTVKVQVIRTVGAESSSSNVLTGFRILDMPTPAAQAGRTSLAFLRAASTATAELQANVQGTVLDQPALRSALTSQAARLSTLIAQMELLIQDPTRTFTLGSVSGTEVIVSVQDLLNAERILLSGLTEFGTVPASGFASQSVGQDCQGGPAHAAAERIRIGTGDPNLAALLSPNKYSSGCGNAAAMKSALDSWHRITIPALGLAALGAVGFGVGLPAATGIALVAAELVAVYTITSWGLAAVSGPLVQESPTDYTAVQDAAKVANRSLARLAESLGINSSKFTGPLLDAQTSTTAVTTAVSSSPAPPPLSTYNGSYSGSSTSTSNPPPGGSSGPGIPAAQQGFAFTVNNGVLTIPAQDGRLPVQAKISAAGLVSWSDSFALSSPGCSITGSINWTGHFSVGPNGRPLLSGVWTGTGTITCTVDGEFQTITVSESGVWSAGG